MNTESKRNDAGEVGPRSPLGRPARVDGAILRAIITVGLLTVLVKLVATAKELAVAGTFGVGDAIDAFLIAWVLPSFAVNVIAGSVQSSLIPTFVAVREKRGDAAANDLLADVMTRSIALLASVTVLLAAGFPLLVPLLASGFAPAKLELTSRLFYLLLPLIPVSGIATIWTSVLNAGNRFAASSLIPIVTPVAILAAIGAWRSSLAIETLAVATVAGAVGELALLAVFVRRHGLALRLRLAPADDATKQVIRQYLPMAGGALVASGTTIVDQAMAAHLGAGSVAALGYGNKLIGLALGIVATALGTAVLPAFSRMVAAANWADLRRSFVVYTRYIIFLAVPATLALVAISPLLVRLLFQRGAFTAEDTALVSAVQRAFAWQIPFYLLNILGVRMLSSLSLNQTIAKIAVANLVVDVVLNIVLSRYFGVVGIALATSGLYVFSSVAVFGALAFHLRGREAAS